MKKLTQKSTILMGFTGLFIVIAILFMPIKADAAVLKNGNTVALKAHGEVYYKLVLEEDSLLKFAYSNNNDQSSDIDVYLDSKRTKVVKYNFLDKKSSNLYMSLKAGTYYIDMYDGYTASKATTVVKFTMTTATKVNKDNFCRAKAISLASGKYVQIVQTPMYDYNRWYKIKVPSTKKITINAPAGGATSIYVYSADLSTRYSMDYTGSTKATTHEKLPAAYYYLYIPSYGSYRHGVLGQFISFKWN